MTSKTMPVTLGGVHLTIPVYHDEETTSKIVAAVNARLAEIEAHSDRIDTQAFALRAATAFAAELMDAHNEQAADTREILHALNRTYDELRSLLKELQSSE